LARFTQIKSLDTFAFAAQPSLNKPLVLELARCEWIEKRQNCITLGPSGTGKTHVALALGLAACQKAYGVAFTTAAVNFSHIPTLLHGASSALLQHPTTLGGGGIHPISSISFKSPPRPTQRSGTIVSAQSCPDYTTATLGYDFWEGHVSLPDFQ
jgi:hypothetical protein